MTRRNDEGNAAIEFVLVAVVVMVPLVWALLAVFQVQRAAFAVTTAAREAGRAYVTDGPARAADAADRAMRDEVPDGRYDLQVTETQAAVTVRVTYRVALAVPFFGRLGTVPVTATHVATPDRFR